MNFVTKTFQELNTTELYQILKIRSEVFVVEQDCVYQDIDFKDQKALHVLGLLNNEIIAYTRIFKAGDYFKNTSIGRVVVSKNKRSFGYGVDIMNASLKAIKENFNTEVVTISAQVYLTKFYNSLGFIQVGDEYLEDGIPHIRMDRK